MSCLLLMFILCVCGLCHKRSHLAWKCHLCQKFLPGAGYVMSAPNIGLLVNAGDIS